LRLCTRLELDLKLDRFLKNCPFDSASAAASVARKSRSPLSNQ
jgi:hypothetical protein